VLVRGLRATMAPWTGDEARLSWSVKVIKTRHISIKITKGAGSPTWRSRVIRLDC
jgi:hypothetical protein